MVRRSGDSISNALFGVPTGDPPAPSPVWCPGNAPSPVWCPGLLPDDPLDEVPSTKNKEVNTIVPKCSRAPRHTPRKSFSWAARLQLPPSTRSQHYLGSHCQCPAPSPLPEYTHASYLLPGSRHTSSTIWWPILPIPLFPLQTISTVDTRFRKPAVFCGLPTAPPPSRGGPLWLLRGSLTRAPWKLSWMHKKPDLVYPRGLLVKILPRTLLWVPPEALPTLTREHTAKTPDRGCRERRKWVAAIPRTLFINPWEQLGRRPSGSQKPEDSQKCLADYINKPAGR